MAKKVQYTTNTPSSSTDYLAADNTWKPYSGGSGGGGIPHGSTSGTDTYTTTISGVTSLSDGNAFLIRFVTGNTTSCTLNINSLGAKTLYRNNDGALIGGDIISGAEMLCVYNSTTDGFQAIGTAPNTLLSYVTNAEATTITKGQAVYAFGGQGDRLKVKLAYNTSDATSAQTIGIVLSTSIAANQKGLIIMQGQIDGLNLFPTSTWADGDPVYLGSTAGSFSHTKPLAPNHLVYLGFVTTASNGSAGRMYVRVQNGYELSEIHDVAITTPSNGQVLTYNSTTDLWENQSIPATSSSSQFFIVGSATGLGAGLTRYGNVAGSTAESQVRLPLSSACTISHLYVRTTATMNASASLAVTLFKNGSSTALTLTIAGGSVAGTYSNTANSISFAAGDGWTLQYVNAGSATAAATSGQSVKITI
jgi:hypothetical protein